MWTDNEKIRIGDFYEDHYTETLDLLEDKQFDDEIKDNYNQIYENEEDDVIWI